MDSVYNALRYLAGVFLLYLLFNIVIEIVEGQMDRKYGKDWRKWRITRVLWVVALVACIAGLAWSFYMDVFSGK